VLVVPFGDHTYVRFLSARTGEMLLELEMLGSGVIVWGAHYRPSEANVRLADDGATVSVSGALRDRLGVVATLGDVLDECARFSVEAGEPPADYGGVVE
jgi:hypothetical protein